MTPSEATDAELISAIRAQDEDSVCRLARADANMIVSDRGWSFNLLRVAIDAGSLAMVKLLHQLGADLTATAYDDDRHYDGTQSPLFAAARLGHVSIVQYLVEATPANDDATWWWSYLLKEAAGPGQAVLCSWLLQRGADPDGDEHHKGEPLYAAVTHGHADVVDLLLAAGAQVHCSRYAAPMLVCGCREKPNLSVVKSLLRAGADPNGNFRGATAAYMCCCRHSDDIDGFDARPILRLLIDTGGINIDATDDGGCSLLWCARHSLPLTRFLLAIGADPDTAPMANMPAAAVPTLYSRDNVSVERERLDLVRERATEICVAMQDLALPAWIGVVICQFACEPFANCVRLGALWKLVVTVKHFQAVEK
jgi:ankyrin repeat protein